MEHPECTDYNPRDLSIAIILVLIGYLFLLGEKESSIDSISTSYSNGEWRGCFFKYGCCFDRRAKAALKSTGGCTCAALEPCLLPT